ncbi:MAG: DEAD/DEAH box helicase [Deltaproteobacteria bacterium]|nr:DEAD/DEAH box helicase [Deltaproteobacteria bacterium]
MRRTQKATTSRSRPLKKGATNNNRTSSYKELHRLEFHRHGFALVPDPSDPRPGVAFFIKGDKWNRDQMFCSCSTYRKKTCPHILALRDLYRAFHKKLKKRIPDDDFRSSVWYRLARVLAEGCKETAHSVRMQFVGHTSRKSLKVLGSDGNEMLFYLSKGPDSSRFIERFGQVPQEDTVPNRAALLDKLALMTLSGNERVMADAGFKTRGRVFEESFFFRLAYHGYRELGASGYTFHPAIEKRSGTFTVTCRDSEEEPVFRMVIPRNKVKEVLLTLKDHLPNQHGLTIHPIPLKSLFKVSMNTELDLELRPLIQLLQQDGEERFFERKNLEKFRYGDLVYLKELELLAELESPGKIQRRFVSPRKMVLKKSQIPSFLQEFGEELSQGSHIVDVSVKKLKIFTEYDHVEISPEALDRDWCWLSMSYGFGNASMSLVDILHAKQKGQRYLPTTEGWIDCESTVFEPIGTLLAPPSDEELNGGAKGIKLSRLDLLRLHTSSRGPLHVTGHGKKAEMLKNILEWRPSQQIPPLGGMTSSLRSYQKLGLEWLYFLFENSLGGLLCDEMGLGKTHQVMALMLALQEHEGLGGPFLVVCPTTVLSHWEEKIQEHAPGLKAAVFHGGQRNLEESLKQGDVLLSTYGILRNDIGQFEHVPLALAVFDEIQYLKNSNTEAYEAAKRLNAKVKLGLTGTPIENTLWELKALFDLTVPGYLGADKDFHERYVQPIEADSSSSRRQSLSMLISPFIIRRLKKTVMDELPDKIEDIRTCLLSDDQIKLYRDAIASRGEGLINVLKKGEEPVPYMHIFALLNLLKQICNHPAQVNGRADDYEQYRSGKWDLFEELILECLDSDQKIVIYSQYLEMIRIIEKFLRGLEVGYVTLTGASRKRGQIISRFNKDPDCRIYVGSLKAGGMGIDLVAASVVIHYDRWWNAAKEDQATDRVHRIGQKRGVQVFKLVTQGTLEEKISAIIEKKRNLMNSIVPEDDPNLLKTFSRQELIEMLAPPTFRDLEA